jgi:hypothetical protein
MTTYTIIPTADGSGFHIGVVGHNGTRHTMLGFESKEVAEAWINHDKRLNLGSEAFHGQEAHA